MCVSVYIIAKYLLSLLKNTKLQAELRPQVPVFKTKCNEISLLQNCATDLVTITFNIAASRSCAVGTKWTQDHIRFLCYQNGNVKGYKPIGNKVVTHRR